MTKEHLTLETTAARLIFTLYDGTEHYEDILPTLVEDKSKNLVVSRSAVDNARITAMLFMGHYISLNNGPLFKVCDVEDVTTEEFQLSLKYERKLLFFGMLVSPWSCVGKSW